MLDKGRLSGWKKVIVLANKLHASTKIVMEKIAMLERRTYERRRHSTAVMQVHSLNKHRNMYIDHISVQSSIALMLTANCSIFSWSIYVHA